MVMIFKERPNSRQQKKDDYQLDYVAHNVDDPNFVRAYAKQYAPRIIQTEEGNVYMEDVEVIPRAKNIMYVRVQYGPIDRDPGSITWGSSCTGGTIHISHAREHIADFAPPAKVAPNHKGAINVEGQDVQGADIVVPVSQRWVEFTHPLGVVTWAFADRLDALVACVNSKPFMGKKAGEVLFTGYSADDGTNKEATVRYDWAISKNRAGFQVADVVGITKDGHDLIWMEYKPDAGGAGPGRKLIACHVERVYERVDFAKELGFGA